MKRKKSLTNKFLRFGRKLNLFKSATKKVAYLKGLGRDLKILIFSFKRLLKIRLVIFCPGSGPDPDPY